MNIVLTLMVFILMATTLISSSFISTCNLKNIFPLKLMVERKVFDSSDALSQELAAYVVKASGEAISKRGKFTIALSGGSLPKLLGKDLIKEPNKSQIDWTKWHVFFADERFVPLTDAESNFLLSSQNLFEHVPIPRDQIYTAESGNGTLESTAEAYQKKIQEVFGTEGIPVFDLVLLGMGPDGHTASLFPGHSLLKESQRLISFLSDSPKPPPERTTFTLPLINEANAVAFVCTGEGKADPVKEILSGTSSLPSALVKPKSGNLVWFLDKPAASKLN